MKRCGRPGCNEPATASFTFNSRARAVWLDHVGRLHASAGHLCHRHADALAPPRGWEIHDRRDLAGVLEHAGGQEDSSSATEPASPEAALEARTPLLARAFRGAQRAS